MSKFYLNVTNDNRESLTVEVRSTVQLVNILQKGFVTMSPVEGESNVKSRLTAHLQKPDGDYFLKSFAKFTVVLENYNGLDVYTVGKQKKDGYSWEQDLISFRTDQLALGRLVTDIMERIREEVDHEEAN